jgi:hypothetical protein
MFLLILGGTPWRSPSSRRFWTTTSPSLTLAHPPHRPRWVSRGEPPVGVARFCIHDRPHLCVIYSTMVGSTIPAMLRWTTQCHGST